MRKRAFVLLASLLIGVFAVFAEEEEPLIIVEPALPNVSELIFNEGSNLWIATNGVVVSYGEARLTADYATINQETGDVLAQGNVNLQQDRAVWRGDRLQYNFKTRQMSTDEFRMGIPPLVASGQGLTADLTNRVYSATNAVLTTDDVARPFYRIQARSLKVVPGKYIEAKSARLYLGSVPILFYPTYHRSLTRHPNNFAFTPGYRSLYGPYLLGEYNWFASTNLGATFRLDYRTKRGVATGADVFYDLGNWGKGELSGYVLRDEDAGVFTNNVPIGKDRHRISFSHHVNLRTNLTAKAVVREQSDVWIVRDFFEREYRQDTQPKSFFEANQTWSNFSLNLLAQPQINDFFQTVERLPDIKFSGIRQQLGVSPFFYESESSAGYFRFQPPDGAPTNSYAALRADTFHQILLPNTFFGWLNFTPRVGGRITQYGETEGFGSTLDERTRTVFNTGAEASFKASRVWRNVESRFFEVKELRHIIEPSVNYVFVPDPSRAPRELPQFDTEIPSLRLLPLEFPDYNSIDSVDSQNVFRLTLRNKLQTKRRDGIDNLVNWALYTDLRIDPREGQSTLADVYSDLDLRPRSWMTLSSETRFDVDAGTLRMANHSLTLVPGDVWSFSVGHRYFREDPQFGPESENNLIFSRVYYKLNENWAFRMTHHYEARDGVLEEQYYTVYRDLRSWTTALTLRLRDNRFGADDITVAITFSLKAFPRFKQGQDRDQPSLLLGG